MFLINELNVIPTGEQWLSGRVLDSRPRGGGLEPHRTSLRCGP